MTEGKELTLTAVNLSGLGALLEFSVLCSACTRRNDLRCESLWGVKPIKLAQVLKHSEELLYENKCCFSLTLF